MAFAKPDYPADTHIENIGGRRRELISAGTGNPVGDGDAVSIWIAADKSRISDSGLGLKNAGKHIIAQQRLYDVIVAMLKSSGFKNRAEDKAVPNIKIRTTVFARQVELILGDLAVIGSGHDRRLIGLAVLGVRKCVTRVELPMIGEPAVKFKAHRVV